jgi:hypothetical protein
MKSKLYTEVKLIGILRQAKNEKGSRALPAVLAQTDHTETTVTAKLRLTATSVLYPHLKVSSRKV